MSQCMRSPFKKTIYGEVIEEDLPDYATKCKPPPPPGREDLWELQFCRWWGWNWVRKKEAYHMKRTDCCEKRPRKENKPIGRHFKDLCKCLCFKKRPRAPPPHLHNLYKTPSNSVMCLCRSYRADIIESGNETKSISCLEVQRSISTRSKREQCSDKSCEMGASSQFSDGYYQGDNSEQTNTSEDCIEYLNVSCSTCTCKKRASCLTNNLVQTQLKYQQTQKRSNTTQDGTECLNVSCTCACKKRSSCLCNNLAPTQKRQIKNIDNNNQTQTSQRKLSNTVQSKKCPCGTQTKPRKSRREKKCIQLLCCHCCCNCNCPGKNVGETKKSSISRPNSSVRYLDDPAIQQIYQCQPENTPVTFEEPVKLNKKLEMQKPLINYRPWDSILYNQKVFPIFANPSRPYPWIEYTKSDILDYNSSFRLDKEFSSPISGKIYRLEPIKVGDVDGSNSHLPDPIEIQDDVDYLKKIKEVKPNLQSRVVLDAICDAILCTTKERVESSTSTLLQEYTYPNIANNIETIDPFIDVVLEESHNKYLNAMEIINNQEETIQEFEGLFKSLLNEDCTMPKNVDQSKNKLGQTPNKECTEINFKELLEDTNDRCADSVSPRENLLCFTQVNQPCINTCSRSSSETKSKRSASPITNQPSKKFKKDLEDNVSSSESLEKNVNKLFRKIDEITVKSKVNTAKIEEVMKSMPYRATSVDKKLQSEQFTNDTSTSVFDKFDEIVTKNKSNNTLNNMYTSGINVNNERRDFQMFTVLTTIKEQSEEKVEDNELDVTNNAIPTINQANASSILKNNEIKKRPSKKSMIPIKKGSSIDMGK